MLKDSTETVSSKVFLQSSTIFPLLFTAYIALLIIPTMPDAIKLPTMPTDKFLIYANNIFILLGFPLFYNNISVLLI